MEGSRPRHPCDSTARLIPPAHMAGLLATLLLTAPAATAFAQMGSIEGTVRNPRTAEPIAATRVAVVGTQLAAMANEHGHYRIDGVPPGVYQVMASVLGYGAITVQNVQVAAGLPVTVDIDMLPSVVRLDAVVVTGTVGETPRAKLPFSVEQLTAEDLPVAQVDPLSAIQAKVAGVTMVRADGVPGTVPTVLLRGPTSIIGQSGTVPNRLLWGPAAAALNRGQEPLYVVDGVILGSGLVDIDALDIETIEIAKGAAASSLYGSRAAAGVIQIRTRRGSNLREGDVRVTVRSEFGRSDLPRWLPLATHHQYALNGDGTNFVDVSGNECDFLECVGFVLAGQGAAPGEGATPWNTYMTQAWPGTTYDQVDRFFTGGNFSQQYVAVSGRSGDANVHGSYSNVREEGIFPGSDGLRRNSFRLNVDQRMGDHFQVSASAFYSRASHDGYQEVVLEQLGAAPAGVDLLALNEDPRLLPDGTVDPNDVILGTKGVWTNPLYRALNYETSVRRSRFFGSGNVRFEPFDWLSVAADVSYDRADAEWDSYQFKGYRTFPPTPCDEGCLAQQATVTQAFNASANLTLNRRLGDLATRAQVRYLGEWDDLRILHAEGSGFTVEDVPIFDNLDPENTVVLSRTQPVRADGIFAITNLDFRDRYILDALVRNDGSSLFGADERRHWYYRVAAAWRVGEDIRLPGVDELKLRYAVGTAGGRPQFDAQYEAYKVEAGLAVPDVLGNRRLKPERATEQEAGLEAVVLGRAAVTVNFARTVVEDQVLMVPLRGYAGFPFQWENAGTLESRTWEAMLDLRLIDSRRFAWSVHATFDRTRARITEWDRSPLLSDWGFYLREGESVGSMYGSKVAQSCADLLGAWECGEFAVNDDGWLVWVGPGGSLADRAWGTQGPRVNDQSLMWGTPFRARRVDPVSGDTTEIFRLGSTLPEFSVGLSTTVRWGALSLYALAQWEQGFDMRSVTLNRTVLNGNAGVMDQSGVPQALRKPLGYYAVLPGMTSWHVYDGSFVKLREVSVRYSIQRDPLRGIPLLRALRGLALAVTGRNLLTFTRYPGGDPEVGDTRSELGSAVLERTDRNAYPQYRTLTVALEVTF